LVPALWNGEIYAVPWLVDTKVLFYNKVLLKRAGFSVPPKSIAELLVYTEKINSVESTYGFGAVGDDPVFLPQTAFAMIYACGSELSDSNSNLTLLTPKNISALTNYIELSRNGEIETQRQLEGDFISGKIGIIIAGKSLTDKIIYRSLTNTFGIAPIPVVESSGKGYAFGRYLAVNVNSDKKSISLEFIKFFSRSTTISEKCNNFSTCGLHTGSFHDNNRKYKAFVTQIKTSKFAPANQKLNLAKIFFHLNFKDALFGNIDAFSALSETGNDINRISKSSAK
jgi:multiple sugar transport system substrate-binding protein